MTTWLAFFLPGETGKCWEDGEISQRNLRGHGRGDAVVKSNELADVLHKVSLNKI